MLRLFILMLAGLSAIAEVKLPIAEENVSWQEIRKRFSGDVEIKKHRDGKLQSLKVTGFKLDRSKKTKI